MAWFRRTRREASRSGVMPRLVTAVVLPCAALAGCGPTVPPLPPADAVVATLATGLTALDLTGVPLDVVPATANAEIAALTTDLDGATPTVTAGAITYDAKRATATATLHYDWALPSGDWTYDASAALTYATSAWQVTWAPTLVHPRLTALNRLVRSQTAPTRADLLAQDGSAIVEPTPVVNVGIDKTRIDASAWDGSARALAGVVGIDPATYAASVAAAGSKAFVIAITLRQYAVPSAVADVPGAYGQAASLMLGPTATFGQPVIGRLRDATADDIAASKGLIMAGEQVGTGGVQRYFDTQLRGKPGIEIYLAARGETPKPTDVPADYVLYNQAAVAGTPVHLSFSVDLQEKAESVMAGIDQPAAAVIIQPSTGAVLAAANSPASASVGDATTGAYAPGSTFKVISSLALLRHGYTPDTLVNCSKTANISGQIIHNYSGYPSAHNGMIPLWQALAWSCNTAFANQYQVVSSADLQAAAGSLGVGIDHTTGGNINFGTVPTADSDAMRAMTMFGQGGDLMNALDMAAVAASVAAGHTVVPWVVSEKQPQPTGAPLTADEAATLNTMMQRVITEGAASSMAGVLLGAKTGTAEWGPADALQTHAWMIGFTGNDLAVCVWVKVGVSGTATAGPIIKQLLGNH